MKTIFFGLLFLLFSVCGYSQKEGLSKCFEKFEKDPQLKAALSSLYVINAKTGAVVFDRNSSIGLAPGSTQKIITSASAYELLGKEFRYKTEFGTIKNGTERDVYIKPSGDPTLGSERWEATKAENVLSRVLKSYRGNGNEISKIVIQNEGWNYETIPDGWVWQDIGNYFGAGADVLNWEENMFRLILKPGNAIGDKVEVKGTEPNLYSYTISSLATTGAKGSGDNSFIYFPLNSGSGVIRGTIPITGGSFTVSGAMPDAKKQFALTLYDSLMPGKNPVNYSEVVQFSGVRNFELLHTEISPSLDSIIYWLNKKSINLYAEALVKTIGFQKGKMGSTEKGVELIKNFWKQKAIDPSQLNILDGSGLSPSNRVTTAALVKVLQYAKKQSWFAGFYNSLPEYNGMKMKSGTIKDVKGFAGYHTSKKGVEYIFALLVNNYNGPTDSLVQKMYQVLDELK